MQGSACEEESNELLAVEACLQSYLTVIRSLISTAYSLFDRSIIPRGNVS